jgi:pimeloyl-ACP methyl ester carboxylesterase
LDWPDDVVELADNLDLQRFAVAGFSGGGPYALACAYKVPERLTTCGMISGVAGTGRFLAFLSTWLPYLVLPVTKYFFRDTQSANQTLKRVARHWVEPDRNALAHPGVRDIMARSMVEAFCPGARGAAYDGTLFSAQDWGFRPEDIAFPNIYLWHGELDRQIPIAAARAGGEKLAHRNATYYPGEGHISVVVNRGREIMEALLAVR